jgi:nucleoid-associated protein YgaU
MEGDIYVVQAGDTLWDIAERKFGDPFHWVTIWRLNPQIEDPDMIHPGDRLRIEPRS